MTNIEQKALELVNEVAQDVRYEPDDFEEERRDVFKALCRVIEQHEAFRQEVSDAVESLCSTVFVYEEYLDMRDMLRRRFIITKPDPLVIEAREICARVCEGWIDIPKDRAAAYRAGAHDDEADFAYVYAALAKRGLEIREKGDD